MPVVRGGRLYITGGGLLAQGGYGSGLQGEAALRVLGTGDVVRVARSEPPVLSSLG
ncbi:hypothetical protein ACFZCT_33695 [Streptomyces qaidamensis]|uniref:hypothetical protein n=1 Tax=Streptomyces qaidamensis TaxID=1783515 RepID=UPI0036E7A6CD